MADVTDEFEMTVVHAGPDSPALVDLSGELDLHAAGDVTSRVADLLSAGPSALHIDTTKLSFVDSSGLQCLLEAKRLADRSGVAFLVVGVSEPLRDLVDMTGTDGMLPGI